MATTSDIHYTTPGLSTEDADPAVVAQRQDVVADGHALQRQRAGLLDRVDQRKVGRAAADVDHQHAVTGAQMRAPSVAVLLDPRV